MIAEETIQMAVRLLAQTAPASRIILFGSYARGTATDLSDLDFLVLKRIVENRRAEIVRLLRVLERHGIPADILVASAEIFDAWKDIPGTVLYEASRGATAAQSGLPCRRPRPGRSRISEIISTAPD
jgi:predicted nucleotidyltransferase